MKQFFYCSIVLLLQIANIWTHDADIVSAPTDATAMINQEFNLSSNQFVNYVFRRFYFINRLEKTMSLLAALDHMTKKVSVNMTAVCNFNDIVFDHEKIQQSAIAVQKKHSLKPLFSIWSDFVEYKSIDDILLVDEFTQEILVISRNLILSCCSIPPQKKGIYLNDFFKTVTLPSCMLLDIIDTYISLFLQYNPSFAHMLKRTSLPHQQESLHPLADVKPFVLADEVMERFYYIQRLEHMFAMLKKVHAHAIPVHIAYHTKDPFVHIDSFTFSHPQVIACATMLHKTKALHHLFTLWDDIKHYKHIHDIQFMKEFLLLVCCVCKSILMEQALQKNVSQKTLASFAALYHTLESLPLEEVLHTIDIVAQELPTLLEKYELTSDMPWRTWLKKYWWTPPLIAATIICKILIDRQIAKMMHA